SADFALDVGHLVAQTPDTNWTDVDPPAGPWYKVTTVDESGNESPPVTLAPLVVLGVTPDGDSHRLWFGGASPNPARAGTAFRFALPAAGPVALELFDLSGRRVRTLVRGVLGAGSHTVAWHGHDDGGAPVPSGVLFARFTAP